MKKSSFTRWLAAWSLASVSWWWPSHSIMGATDTKRAVSADPSLDIVTALEAKGPHPSLGDHAKAFERFVGTWDVEYTDYAEDGKTSHRSGEYILGWVMDGRAIQDVFVVYPSASNKEREVFTDLRYFDPKSGTWHAAFIDPQGAYVARFTGAAGDDRMAFQTQDFAGTETRWSYTDIRPNSFVWREEESKDGGKTWRLSAELHMKRRGAAAQAAK